MSKYFGWDDEDHTVRFWHNEQLSVSAMKNGEVVAMVHDVKSGNAKTWKVKIDPDCGYVYSVQKTQIKTILTDMSRLAETLLDFLGDRLADCAGFRIDYSYDIQKIAAECQKGA